MQPFSWSERLSLIARRARLRPLPPVVDDSGNRRPTPQPIGPNPDRGPRNFHRPKLMTMDDAMGEVAPQTPAAATSWTQDLFSGLGSLAGTILKTKGSLELGKYQAKSAADLQQYQLQMQAQAWNPMNSVGAMQGLGYQREYEAQQRALAFERSSGLMSPTLGSMGTVLALGGVALVAVLLMNRKSA
jgi:hypothetical protein